MEESVAEVRVTLESELSSPALASSGVVICVAATEVLALVPNPAPTWKSTVTGTFLVTRPQLARAPLKTSASKRRPARRAGR